MTQPRRRTRGDDDEARGANRRGGSEWGDEIGYSNERTTTAPQPRHVTQEPAGPRCIPYRPQRVTFADGTRAVIIPLAEYGVGQAGAGQRNMVVEVCDD